MATVGSFCTLSVSAKRMTASVAAGSSATILSAIACASASANTNKGRGSASCGDIGLIICEEFYCFFCKDAVGNVALVFNLVEFCLHFFVSILGL